MSGMQRVQKIRAMEHQRALRNLATVDGELARSRAALSAQERALMAQAQRAPITAAQLVDADAQRAGLTRRIASLAQSREQAATATRASALASKQVELMVERQRAAALAESEARDARVMDELGAQAWNRR